MYTRIELRVILIGEMGVGKKSIVKRFKMINTSETKIISTKEEKNYNTKETKETNISENNTLITEPKTKKEIEREKIENEERNMRIKREEKRMDLMNFSLIYKVRMNYFEAKFYPCIEGIPLEYDYESKEDDDDLIEIEKEYKFSLRPLLNEIKEIVLNPPENSNNQLEFLFLLCFDLSNYDSYKRLLIYFNQIEKNMKISGGSKIALIGNKLDKKISISKEEKKEINQFKNKIKANYYEISTMMFFPFDKFFENLIEDNFKDFPFLTNEEDKNIFHDILMKKNNFSKAERKIGGDHGISGEIKFKYNKDQYEYPSTIKGLLKIFQDPDKFNKSIFLTKIGAILPPVKKKVKDKEYSSIRQSNNILLSKINTGIKINKKNQKVQEALELTSRKPGYTFGFNLNSKSLNLKKQRKALSEARYNALEQFIKDNTTKLYQYKLDKNKVKNDEKRSQIKYEKNREELKQKKEDDIILINEQKQLKHKENVEKNEEKEKKRIDKILEKKNKYDKKFSEEKKSKEKKRIENITKNNLNFLNSSSKVIEPKAKFYTPKTFILTNKGFTFGHKHANQDKIIKKDYPEFPLFKDDFEKILLKNKKILHTSTGERFPEYKAPENIDDSKLKENQKKYEKKRELNLMSKTIAFKEKRNDWKEKVESNKKGISLQSDLMLEEYIKRIYNGEDNYLRREINYTQVENASPKFSFREKTDFGSVFAKESNNNNDTYYNSKSTKLNTLYLENPNINYTHLRYPKFSFGKSKRFNSTSDNFQENNNDYHFTNTDYNYTQSFLKAQTYMGTGKKLELKYNGVPGPNVYKIKRFADDVVEKGNKFESNKIKSNNIDNFLETK